MSEKQVKKGNCGEQPGMCCEEQRTETMPDCFSGSVMKRLMKFCCERKAKEKESPSDKASC